jgi:AraC-like DNA-binding protein
MTAFLVLPPAPPLAPYVAGYWFVEDIAGVHEGRPIATSPHPGAVLSVNFGRPNAMVGGPTVPRVSLLGVQQVVRRWRSWSETYFVMAMLTVHGLARLFPNLGRDSMDRLLDLSAVLGDRGARLLGDDLDAARAPGRIGTALDRWLLQRLSEVGAPPALPRLVAAHEMLRSATVEQTASRLEVSRRQLNRWFREHLGVGPRRLMEIERLHDSLRAMQRGGGDPLAGYSDQPHQIRSWRRRLGVTPGRYARGVPSPMARYFSASDAAAPAFYL